MRMPKTARAIAVVLGSLGAAGAVASSTQASAQTVEFPQTPSVFYGGLCWGNIRTWADTSPDYPGRAVLNVQALPIQGVGPGQYPLAPLCNVDTTVSWTNTTTGATGQYRLNVVSGIYGSILYALFQDTGPGHIEVVVTTNNLSLPAHGSFDVPGPPPGPIPTSGQ
ncbi:hypothetical protein IU500_07850 [Nocardia terpenica]|nr:hypothetical protein [Nocardia terpenica]MBF6103950.1 hypothetical protein [Nocardia terpenica]MBF6111676.1 hypothetical protein [Nocardia terpenica]MBF6118171.1 hypothetical protein [Nocardia terpenica]MBF6156435.1 hypothetical protein [Nocardia terpenica]